MEYMHDSTHDAKECKLRESSPTAILMPLPFATELTSTSDIH